MATIMIARPNIDPSSSQVEIFLAIGSQSGNAPNFLLNHVTHKTLRSTAADINQI
jgi:hypothetical protein